MQQQKPKVLVVDDEKNILNTVGICLESIGIDATLCAKPQDVLQLLQENVFDIAFVDLKMSPMDGIEVLTEIKQYSPGTTVIIMTAHGSVDSAVAAVLIHEAIGDQLTCVFVDHGLLRLNEAETVARCIEKARLGLQRAGVPGEIHQIDGIVDRR